jgi:hypothetical protein
MKKLLPALVALSLLVGCSDTDKIEKLEKALKSQEERLLWLQEKQLLAQKENDLVALKEKEEVVRFEKEKELLALREKEKVAQLEKLQKALQSQEERLHSLQEKERLAQKEKEKVAQLEKEKERLALKKSQLAEKGDGKRAIDTADTPDNRRLVKQLLDKSWNAGVRERQLVSGQPSRGSALVLMRRYEEKFAEVFPESSPQLIRAMATAYGGGYFSTPCKQIMDAATKSVFGQK